MNWHELFTYANGHLLWKAGQRNNVIAGAKAGSPRDGYLLVMVSGRNYGVHQIIWEMHNGPVPAGMFIDHDDRVRNNNLLSNLRLVTRLANNQNKGKPRNNTSGTTGVRWNKRENRWKAFIGVNGKQVHLGSFKTEAEAVAARKDAEELYGFHINHGT